jgi:hypothetical protein
VLPRPRRGGPPPHELQAAARAAQPGKDWQHDYKRRAGIEATISQAVSLRGTA